MSLSECECRFLCLWLFVAIYVAGSVDSCLRVGAVSPLSCSGLHADIAPIPSPPPPTHPPTHHRLHLLHHHHHSVGLSQLAQKYSYSDPALLLCALQREVMRLAFVVVFKLLVYAEYARVLRLPGCAGLHSFMTQYVGTRSHC